MTTLPLISINKKEISSNGDHDGGLRIYELTTYGDGIIPALYNARITVKDAHGDVVDTLPLVDAPTEVIRDAEREVAQAFLDATTQPPKK